MTPEQFIHGQVAAFCHREAHAAGGLDNLLAVACVLRNRQRAGWHGGDWMAIIAHHGEAQGTVYLPSVPDLGDVTFRRFLARVGDVLSGSEPDVWTQGALYYCELNRINPATAGVRFVEKILGNPAEHPRVAQVGPVTFFK